MEGTIGEIRIFAGNFAPRGWQLCQGQTLSIATDTTLFSIIGTTYGGDGQSTFKLPDLQSRIPVGTGSGPGLPVYDTGEAWGSEGVSLISTQMPMHSHAATVSGGDGTATFDATLYGVNDAGGVETPAGNILGVDSSGGASYAASGTQVAMHSGSVVVNNLHGPLPTIGVGVAGGSQPHSNIQPVLAVNYIICVEGIYPSRN